MSSSEKHVAFQLKDFFNEDPLYIISHSSPREDISFFDAYDDYAQDLGCLRIAWQRIRQECKEIGEINTHQGHLRSSDEGYINESSSLFLKQRELMNILQYDVRSFIDIARTIMDKLAKIIEKLLGLSTGIGPRVSFTDHKKKLPTYPNIHPGYLDLLQNRTYWYEQELLLLRDKVFAHGNTFTTMPKISWIGGITIFKRSQSWHLKGKHKIIFLDIKDRYKQKNSDLSITDRDDEMLDDFLRQTRILKIKLEDTDVEKLRNIVSSFGIAIDEEFLESIAQHIEDFIKEVAVIFKVRI